MSTGVPWIALKHVLFAGMLFTYATSSSAQEYPLKIVTEHWPPYNYLSEDGELRGSATNYVQQIVNQAKLRASIEVLSWTKAYQLALQRPNTLIFSIFRTPEREALFDWYCPITEPVDISLYKLRNRTDLTINRLDDAKQSTLGVVRNDYANAFLQSKGFSEGQNLLVSTDEAANLRQLLHGRIDLVVQAKASIEYRLMELGRPLSEVEIALQSIDGKKLISCMALSRGSDQPTKAALDRAFTKFSPTIKDNDLKVDTGS